MLLLMHFQHKQADIKWRSLWWLISPEISKNLRVIWSTNFQL